LFVFGDDESVCCKYAFSIPLIIGLFYFLLGGGARERIFWKNYFFHCAYTRYEAGLSIDEIWSEGDQSSTPASLAVASATLENDEVEDTITFNNEEEADVGTNNEKADALFVPGVAPSSGTSQKTTLRSESDYEMVDVDGSKIIVDLVVQNDEVINTPMEDADYELDELEAEIARELED
jgi:hypothetical protein